MGVQLEQAASPGPPVWQLRKQETLWDQLRARDTSPDVAQEPCSGDDAQAVDLAAARQASATSISGMPQAGPIRSDWPTSEEEAAEVQQ